MSTLASSPDHSLYSNAFGYLRQPLNFTPDQSNADVAILGVPFDMATTGRSGARMGPGAIRQASTHLAWEEQRWPWDFKLSDRLSIIDVGDFIFAPGDAEAFTQSLAEFAYSIIQGGKTLLSFGGDHFITLPLLRAHHKKHGELAMIHFDAHTDTYSAGSRFDHGTMFYHAPKEGLISAQHSIQIGIRTDYTKQDHPFTVISGVDANNWSTETIIDTIRQRIGDRPVYVTFDIDCLDPAFAPGTGTPVCGGISSHKALEIIRGLQGINLIGMDIVEVAPSYDNSEVTSLAAATLGLELLHVLTTRPEMK
ncbi:agmatinase [Pleionea litopenaei]|uniref:Agmatinase n=1 Tax=Pleionea litopenaei TaxID=3070815 RepID=A0AA51RU47_9GAMM|nr:agmatinase [Pleionea sp. HL-JVS1]WMS87544.1 agmatinase [Pleionea sp. HL-JVS1]